MPAARNFINVSIESGRAPVAPNENIANTPNPTKRKTMTIIPISAMTRLVLARSWVTMMGLPSESLAMSSTTTGLPFASEVVVFT